MAPAAIDAIATSRWRQLAGFRTSALSAASARNLFLGLLVAAAAALGLFAPIDRVLIDKRFTYANHAVSGQIATVEIDSQSLNEVGVWPWPRALHGQLVDKLIALGARRIVFDIDFSAVSSPENDHSFADALHRAKGKVWLATFLQAGGANGRTIIDAPLPALAENAGVVAIDVPLAPDGFVRNYFTSLDIGGWPVQTAGARLADRPAEAPRAFGVDYGLDLAGVTRLSAADLLAGRVPAILVAGRDIIIGASAEELRDVFLTPRFGVLPGLAVHVLAAETLLMGRQMRPMPTVLMIALIGALAIAAAALERRLNAITAVAALAVAGVGVEAGAFSLHKWAALMTPTAGVQIALAAFAVAGLAGALRLRRRLHDEAARERDVMRAMLNQVVADNFDGVVVIGDDGRILEASRPAREILNRTLRGRNYETLPVALAQIVAAALQSPELAASVGEAQLMARTGATRHLDYVVTISHVSDTRDRRVVCLTFRDVTERRAHLARLDYLARHDEMTGALTRGELLQHLRQQLALGPEGLTVYCVALRRFDLVNDVFGHRVGDLLLACVVERLRDLGFPEVARLGGASFAFAAAGAADAEALPSLCSDIVDKIALPYLVRGHTVIVGASLGVTTSLLSGADAAALLTHASMAQSSTARRIGDVFAVFSPDLETRRRWKQALDADLRQAVADSSLEMHFQAKVDLATGKVIGAEALMRWQKADGAQVSPADFVPVAEESGLIVELGRFALRRACAEAAGWPSETVVAVNVSPVQFGLTDVFTDVQTALLLARLPPHRLQIEITESAFVDGDKAITTALDRLRAIGVTIALDDFGTGYSSLHYLGRLPIDTIKIDQSFVRAMEREPTAAATIGAIVALAKAHGKSLVAEGIESTEDAARLLALGCENGQGYHFGRPIEAAAFLAAIRGGRAAAA